jgi:hypothetical protein
MPLYPNESLPKVQLSLSDFVFLGKSILTETGDVPSFVRFMLGGRWQNNGEFDEYPETGECRVFVNARQGAFIPRHGQYRLSRDIDTVIGISYDLPFTEAMAVLPISSFADTLRKTNHLTVRIQSGQVNPSLWRSVPYKF